MKDYIVVFGVKLFNRTCEVCPNTFRVPDSSPQVFCSEMCHEKGLSRKDRFKPKRKKKLTYKLKRSDYEKS